ncbi:MAG: hypothetical protein FWG88_07895 [Oscillospiraceae bacterium]|nr:hypothetical protein [Oscillospiraceae bacterium]
MEIYRQVINSSTLDGVISLPDLFQNKRVIVTVSLVRDEKKLPLLSIENIDDMLKGSITESLIGVIQNSQMSLEEDDS